MSISKRIILQSLLPLVCLAALLFANGALRAQIETQSDDVVDAANALTDMAFFAAGDLTVSAKSTDDIFAAGGDVTLDEAQADHMIVAGGEITVTNVAFHDLIVAGGDINFVTGVVTDDIVAAGGEISVSSEFKMNGSAVFTGGDVDINAPVGGELRAAAARLKLDADVEGDAHLVGEEVTIGPDVRIGGDLRHRARDFNMDPSAVVTGEIIMLEPATPPDLEKWGVQAAAAAALFALALLASMAVFIVLIALVLPGLMNSASAMIHTKPLSTLGIGFLAVIAALVAIGVLFATVLGIPLALAVVIFYLAAAPLAIAAFVYFIGMFARRQLSGGDDTPSAAARVIWSALATIMLVIIGLVPIAGGFIWLIAYTLGMGAVVIRGGKALAEPATA